MLADHGIAVGHLAVPASRSGGDAADVEAAAVAGADATTPAVAAAGQGAGVGADDGGIVTHAAWSAYNATALVELSLAVYHERFAKAPER